MDTHVEIQGDLVRNVFYPNFVCDVLHIHSVSESLTEEYHDDEAHDCGNEEHKRRNTHEHTQRCEKAHCYFRSGSTLIRLVLENVSECV
jgi:hypothetical protein